MVSYFPQEINPTFNLPNQNERFVVEEQEPTAANNYTWYRKYNDGWVEQGVLELSFTTTPQTWTFVIPMTDTHYISIPVKQSNNNNNIIVYRHGTTACKYNAATGSTQTNGIYICGMAATVPTYSKIQCIRY